MFTIRIWLFYNITFIPETSIIINSNTYFQMIDKCFQCNVYHFCFVFFPTENQVMSDGEQDLPPDVVPIPSPPPRYHINMQIICDPSLIFKSYFCQMALMGWHFCLFIKYWRGYTTKVWRNVCKPDWLCVNAKSVSLIDCVWMQRVNVCCECTNVWLF